MFFVAFFESIRIFIVFKIKKDFVDMYSLNASYAGDYHSFGPLF